MTDYYDQFDAAGKAFDENTLSSCDNDTLQKHLIALANEPVPNDSIQHRNIIRGITINHILLQRHIDILNKQNSKIQKWVIALAVAALIAGAAQAIAAILPYIGLFPKPPIALQPPKSLAPTAIPNQLEPRVSGQSNYKNP